RDASIGGKCRRIIQAGRRQVLKSSPCSAISSPACYRSACDILVASKPCSLVKEPSKNCDFSQILIWSSPVVRWLKSRLGRKDCNRYPPRVKSPKTRFHNRCSTLTNSSACRSPTHFATPSHGLC